MPGLTEHQIAAIVLAGGESSRMGRDKALLTINGKTMLSQICAVAREITNDVYVITPWIERYRPFIAPSCQLIKEKLVLNAKSNAPIIGFAQALRVVKAEWILLLACDLPYLASSQVKQWLPSLTTVLPTEIALLPRNHKGWDALCGFYRRNCLSSLEFYIENGGRSFQGWLTQHSVRELLLEDRSCLFNCNTLKDWQSIE